jgi:hypothetical protein
MTLRLRKHSSREWPFWLLLVAWACANTPQIAVFTMLTWMAEGRSFTHQERLKQDVARLLAGQKPTSPIADAVAEVQKRLPAKPPAPVPADLVMKKLELAIEETCDALPARVPVGRYDETAWRCPAALCGEPPHGPPRVSVG